jgi:hypothetical protein
VRNAKEFAEKYANQYAIVVESDPNYKYNVGTFGRVVGYTGGLCYVLLEISNPLNDEGFVIGEWESDIFVVDTDTINNKYQAVRTDCLEPMPTPPQPSNTAYDCLDCGSKGNEPCKNTCPNR